MFNRRSFRTLEGESRTTFVDDDYFGPMCMHAEAVVRRELKRLVVTLPSGTYKSRTWAVNLVAWGWLHDPSLCFLVATNDESLGYQHSTDCRKLVRSAWYRKQFCPPWAITEDQDSKKIFANTAGGRRQMIPVGGDAAGKKGDILLVDDLHDAQKVHSPTYRKADKDWFRNAFWDRQKSFVDSAVVVVGHRLDKDDLASELIAEGWPELRFPERMEEHLRKPFPLGGIDTRKEGQYLRPSRFGPAQEENAKATYGEKGWSAKHQQEPKAVSGSMFPSDRLRIIPAAPSGIECVRYWDTASTVGENSAHTSGVLIGRSPLTRRWVIVDVHRGKWTPAERDREIRRVAFLDRARGDVSCAAVWVEQEPGGSGVTAVDYFIREMAGFNVRAWRETGNKVVRAQPLSAQWCTGNVDVVEGPWNKGYLDRMENFPGLKDKDDADATTGGFNRLALGSSLGVDPAAGKNPVDELPPGTFRGANVNVRDERF